MGFKQDLLGTLTDLLELSVARQTSKMQAVEPSGPKQDRERFLVALSGGCDSTALLVGLKQLIVGAELSNFEMFACHINHGLRAEESDADEDFCQRLCSSLDIELYVRSGKDLGHHKTRYSEEHLREVRYELLLAAARQAQARYLLTGHTLDDQVETILFRLWRGTSIKGLTGIDSLRRLAHDLFLIRPLLTISKNDCRAFLLANNLSGREDSSNTSNTYTRNYLRNTIIPTIEARFPRFMEHLNQLREILEAEEQLLSGFAEHFVNKLDNSSTPGIWAIKVFNEAPLALKRRAVAWALHERGIEVTYKRIEAIVRMIQEEPHPSKPKEKKAGNTLNLNGTWRVRRTETELLWLGKGAKVQGQPSCMAVEIPVRIPGTTIAMLAGRVLQIEPFSNDLAATTALIVPFPPQSANEALVDLSKIQPPIVLRSRAPGDQICPLGMSQKVRLKKYLHTHKRTATGQLLSPPELLLADKEEILWIPGIGLSNKIRVEAKPTHRLKWLKLADDEVRLT